MVSCDNLDSGCKEGYSITAWMFLTVNGVPSEKCVSYKSGEGKEQACPSKCDDGSSFRLYKSKNNRWIKGKEAVKEEIMKNGPVPLGLIVYEDLLSYKSGVYKHVSGSLVGAHTAKVIGWGVDPEAGKYWIIANSWGTNWGEKGYFKVIESDGLVEENAFTGEAFLG